MECPRLLKLHIFVVEEDIPATNIFTSISVRVGELFPTRFKEKINLDR